MTMTTPTTETGIVEKVARASDLHIVFDGPPGNESGRFVECETPGGKSINAGEWHERADGLWELRISRAAIAAMPDSTQLLQTTAGALEAFAKVTAAYDYWCAEVMPDFTYPVDGTRLESAIQDCPAAIGQLTRSDFERAKAALAQLRAQEQRS